MSACPNKNSKEWENLLSQVDGNEIEAEYAFIKNGYEIPNDIDDVRESEEYEYNEESSLSLTQLKDVRNNIIHALTSKYRVYEFSDNKKYVADLKKLIDTFVNSNYDVAFEAFIDSASNNVHSLNKKMEEKKDDLETLNLMNNFAGTFELIDQLTPLMDDGVIELSDEVKDKARRVSQNVKTIRNKYLGYARSTMVHRLAAESTVEREKKKEALSRDYERAHPDAKRDTEFKTNKRKFIENALNDAAEEIKQAEIKRLRMLLLTAPVDISGFTKMMIDGTGVNEPIIQLAVKILNGADFRAKEAFIDDRVEAARVHEAFVKGESVKFSSIGNISDVVSKLKENQKFITLTDDEKHYINSKTGKKYKRVTSYISNEKVNPSELLTSAGVIGTKIDEMIRDYFSTNDFNRNNYDVIPEDIKDTFISQLEDLREKFKESGETVVSEDILLFDDKIGVAGTVDILTYDEDGNFRIYDMKTMRRDHFKDVGYGLPYDSTTVFDKNNKPIKGKIGDSRRIKHSKQLSMYSELLKSQTGRGAVELGIIPVKVSYDAGDVTSTEADIRKIEPLNFTKVKKLNIKRENKVSDGSLQGGVNKKGLVTNQKKLYEGIIEKIDGEETQYYVSEFFSTYNEALKEHYKELAPLDKKKDKAERKKITDKWDKKHLKDPSIKFKNGKYDSSNIKDEFKNPQFKELDNNPAVKGMYDYLIEFNKQSDSMVTGGNRLGFKLPSSTQGSIEKINDQGGISYVKDKWTDLTKIKADDYEYGNIEQEDGVYKVLTDQFGNALKRISVPMRGNLDITDQSYDLMGMALTNRFISRNFKEKNNVLPDMQVLQDLMGERKVGRKKGNKTVMRSINAIKGVTDEEIKDIQDTVEGSQSKSYELLEGILEARLYGKVNITSSLGPWADKTTSALITASSHTMLIANVLGGASNLINGKVMNMLEASKGSYGVFNKSNLFKAEKLYWGDISKITGDVGRYVPESMTNKLIEKFLDTSMDFSGMSNDLTKDNKAKRLNNVGSLHAFNSVGEHYIQGSLMYAALDNIKLKNKKGQYIGKNGQVVSTREEATGMYYGYDNTDGGLKWNDSFTVEGYSTVDSKAEQEINAKIKDILADLQGMYDKVNKSQVEREWYGKAATFLRRWMVRGVQRRWRGFTTAKDKWEDIDDHLKFYSESAQSYKEGTYASLGRYLWTNMKSLKDIRTLINTENWHTLTDMEKGNIRSAVTELAMIAGSFAAAALLRGLAEGTDEEDEQFLYTQSYLMRRLYGDLAQYIPILGLNDSLRTLRTPSATLNVVESSYKIFQQAMEDSFNGELEVYQSGDYKNESKLKVNAFKLLFPPYKHLIKYNAKKKDDYLNNQ